MFKHNNAEYPSIKLQRVGYYLYNVPPNANYEKISV